MDNKLGTKETKELLKFVITLGESIDSALEDNKITVTDIGSLIAPLMLIGPALEDVDKVTEELKDLTNVEMNDLVAFVETELDIKSDRTEELIEEGIALAMRLFAFVKLVRKKK